VKPLEAKPYTGRSRSIELTRMASPNVEMYLEVIYGLTERGVPARTKEIAEHLKVAPASVTEMMKRLSADGYLVYEPYRGVTMTKKGRQLGMKVLRKHMLLERFLKDILRLDEESYREQACKLEHVLSDEAEMQLCRILNVPQLSTDGTAMPKCELGDACLECGTADYVTLDALRDGERARVSHLASQDPDELRRAILMGFLPGTQLEMGEQFASGKTVLVKLKDQYVALDRMLARALHVLKMTHQGEHRRVRR